MVKSVVLSICLILALPLTMRTTYASYSAVEAIRRAGNRQDYNKRSRLSEWTGPSVRKARDYFGIDCLLTRIRLIRMRFG